MSRQGAPTAPMRDASVGRAGPLPAFRGELVLVTARVPVDFLDHVIRPRHEETGEPLGAVITEFAADGVGYDLASVRLQHRPSLKHVKVTPASARAASVPRSRRGPLPTFGGARTPTSVRVPIDFFNDVIRPRHEETGQPLGPIVVELAAIGAKYDLTPVKVRFQMREVLPLAG